MQSRRMPVRRTEKRHGTQNMGRRIRDLPRLKKRPLPALVGYLPGLGNCDGGARPSRLRRTDNELSVPP